MVNRRTFLKYCGASPAVLARGRDAVPGLLEPGRSSVIWDVHCHITSASGETPEQRVTQLLEFADRLRIDRLVLSLGYPLLEDPSPEQLRETNDQVLRALRHAPDRTVGFVYLNPNHPAFSLQEFDRCVRDGPMVGIKLWVARRSNAPELDPIVERAVSMKAVILQHTWLKVGGNLPGESTPYDLVELARRHPQAAFIDAHTGGDWELGIGAIRSTKNVSACMAGFDPTSGSVEMAVRELGAERVVYGSDAAGRSFASQLAKVMGAEIPEAARRLVLGENLRRMLTPILRAKGRQV
jgi:uncharacterized protein